MKKMINRFLSFAIILTILFSIIPSSVFAAATFEEVEAASALLVDVQYDDTILYDKDAHIKRPPASITKVMTALLILEAIQRGDLTEDSIFTASLDALSDITSDSSTANIQPGEQLSVENLLYCLLCPSANEAANILAEGLSGSISAFVDAMNARAQELGMTNTHFSNPHGLHRDNHYTTAYDIFLMTKEAMTYPLFQKIVSTASYEVPATNMSDKRVFYNTNALLSNWKYAGYTYDPTTGVKTGHTPEAGFCLVSSAQKNGRSLIAVVLGADTIVQSNGEVNRKQFSESKRLLRWGFSNFKSHTLLGADTLMREVPVSYGKGVSYVLGCPSETIDAILPNTYDPELLNFTVSLNNETIEAPVKKDQVLGTVTVSYDGQEYGTTELIAVNDVERSTIQFIFSGIKAFLGSILFRLLILAFVGMIILRFIRSLRHTPRKGNKPKQNKQSKQNKQNKPTSRPKVRR